MTSRNSKIATWLLGIIVLILGALIVAQLNAHDLPQPRIKVDSTKYYSWGPTGDDTMDYYWWYDTTYWHEITPGYFVEVQHMEWLVDIHNRDVDNVLQLLGNISRMPIITPHWVWDGRDGTLIGRIIDDTILTVDTTVWRVDRLFIPGGERARSGGPMPDDTILIVDTAVFMSGEGWTVKVPLTAEEVLRYDDMNDNEFMREVLRRADSIHSMEVTP